MSVTNMNLCTHGPKKDCHACLVGELVAILERCLPYIDGHFKAWSYESDRQALNRVRSELLRDGCAVLEKAKQLEDCIPIEDAPEVIEAPHRY